MTARPAELAAESSADTATWHGRSFGLDVFAPEPIVGVPEAGTGSGIGATRIRFVSTSAVDDVWAASDARRLFSLHYSDGGPFLTVDYSDSVGYRIWAPYHGRHLVSTDGTSVLSARPRRAGWWWQRLVLAQVLPIAASAQGVDLLHASAVVLESKAIAITATSGTGKTTLAAHLLDAGAELLADDVLALELNRNGVLAHPGVALVNIDPAQRSQLGPRGAQALAATAGTGDKLYVLADLAGSSKPLGAVYFLRRDADAADLEFNREADARKLLGSSFVPYVQRPEYLLRHLDVCSRIADVVPVFTLRAPAGMPAGELAAAVVAHGEDAS
jgi:hypothetical protein